MLSTLIEKECREIFSSPRFIGAFTVVSILLALSVAMGIAEYRAFQRARVAAEGLAQAEMSETTSWRSLSSRVYRSPDVVQILAAGVHNDVGKVSLVSSFQEPALQRSVYTDDPIFALFRFLDPVFIVEVVLSLFAILLTYDAVSGERERGTLQLALAHPVPRARFLVAKVLGTWLGLAVPLLIPLSVGGLMALATVPLTARDGYRIGVMVLGAGLYFSFFVVLGVAVSTWTRRASGSFLALLVIWIVMILIVPRTGIMTAVSLFPVPSAAEVDSRRAGFEREAWERHHETVMKNWEARQAEIESVDESEREAFEDEQTWDWMEEDELARRDVQARITEYGRRLVEEVRNLQEVQQSYGLGLSRVSPAASFRLLCLRMAGTGLELKTRYEDAIDAYRQSFVAHVQSKGETSHMMVRRRSGGSSGSPFGDQNEPLDLRDLPRFSAPGVEWRPALQGAVTDLTLLALSIVMVFVLGFVGFLRYDVRAG